MPVLIVSLKTSPQDGFSRKRVIFPSSSVMTTPNWSGFLAWVRTIVAMAFLSSWNRMAAERSKSVRTSPLMTRMRSFSPCVALPDAPCGAVVGFGLDIVHRDAEAASRRRSSR